MTTKRDIGLEIQIKRKKAGLTQDELAKKIKVAKDTISRIERGRFNYTIDLLFRIANALDCNISEFFGVSERRVREVTLITGSLEDIKRVILGEEKKK